HTRSKRDWSSDVCSSDLPHPATLIFSRPKTPFQCKALGHLEQTLHAYIPRKAYRSLSSESRQTATAAQLEAIWLYQQVHNTIEKIGRASCRERVYIAE